MKLSDFDYYLPDELIAHKPVEPRDHSRLLVLSRRTGEINHQYFYNIVNFFKKGDVLVINNSKVIKARLIGKKRMTHGKVEILLHFERKPGEWEVIGKNLKVGLKIFFNNSKLAAIILSKSKKTYVAQFNMSGNDFFREIERIGFVPLPPYIKREKKEQSDEQDYQTIFALNNGSVAAPTAGLHFTPELIELVRKKGIIIAEVTLHVGLGTFLPVSAEDIISHEMHSEFYTVEKKEYDKIIQAKKNSRRIIAVGTTSARVLETIFSPNSELLTSNSLSGWTDIFIYPGYGFRCVDGLITNFHLPKSTLLMLVCAFAGRDKIFNAYKEAISKKYRFYSYGDGMLII